MAANHYEQPKTQRTLAEEIQLATRSVHARLNKLIIDRLPLALPPNASNPSMYLSGLLHIAPIYITFEELWGRIVDAGFEGSAEEDHDSRRAQCKSRNTTSEHRSDVDERIRDVLERLRLPGMARSSQLKADLRSLTGWSEHGVRKRLQAVSRTGRLGDFISHIKRVVDARPHVLLAYSYTMFMALFAGGRIIRASLESAGDDFWEQTAVPCGPPMPQCTNSKPHSWIRVPEGMSGDMTSSLAEQREQPLRFFHFETPMHGEDLKLEFKKRLRESEQLLTDKERHEIVQEALCIFNNMSLLIHQLDVFCLKQAPQDSADDIADMLNYPVTTRLRDSVVVTHDRYARRSSRRISASEDGLCVFARNKSHANAKNSINNLAPGKHPVVALPSLMGVELCPALSKSMRFENPFLKTGPVESASVLTGQYTKADAGEGGVEPTASGKLTRDRIYGIHVTNWVIMAAFGVMILGALATGRVGVASRVVMRL